MYEIFIVIVYVHLQAQVIQLGGFVSKLDCMEKASFIVADIRNGDKANLIQSVNYIGCNNILGED